MTSSNSRFSSKLSDMRGAWWYVAMQDLTPSPLLDWYIQAGTGAMQANAEDQRTFMFGGAGDDHWRMAA
ncbi:MAG: hypothetical protein BWK76_24980 [Desulfobulbaceae bacterium A2]|nr:MAG: hypothetical protein BWK76_24980 [Desulfobulbaceae bacterium A2]